MLSVYFYEVACNVTIFLGGIIIIVTKDGAEFVPRYKGQLIPLMKSLEDQGQWKKLTVEAGMKYCMEEKAVVWIYQVLVKSSN